MIAQNLLTIKESIERAAAISGRDAGSVRLIAVSKTHPIQSIREAYDAGHRCFGESRIQEATPKIATLPGDIDWHFIGPLQSNKVKAAVQIFSLIHSVDSEELATSIDRRAAQFGKIQNVLIEINIGVEQSKHGIRIEALKEVLPHFLSCSHLQIRGIMAIPPFDSDPEKSRTYFRVLKEEADSAWRFHGLDTTALELSMGMSSDFEIAVQEGATMIRVGTSIFGSRE